MEEPWPEEADAALTGLADQRVRELRLEATDLGQWDTSLLVFLVQLVKAARARELGLTRSAVAMDKAAALGRPLVLCVGNAPTALVRICELLDSGELVRPALVVGVPVGFVNVVESKELLLAHDVDRIVARGRKGGSNIAATICNALMYACRE